MRKAVFLIVLIGLLVPSCSEIEGTQEHEKVTVTLKLAGDVLVDVTHNPMTKAYPDDLYAVNVFRGNSDNVYASGLFDDVSAMNVTLISGYTYTFTCCLIKNGKSALYYGKAFGLEEEGYAYPFQRGTGDNTRSTKVENQFVYSSTLTGIKNGLVHLKGDYNIFKATIDNAVYYASVDRYYGETSNYTPVHNGVVEINLKRVCFGVQFEISGLAEGIITVGYGIYSSDNHMVESSIDNNGLSDINILSFADPYDCWYYEKTHPNGDPYSISSTFTITYHNVERDKYLGIWNKSTEVTVPLTRNVVTKIKITLDPDLSAIIPSFTEEPFSDENMINLEVQGGALIDTGVKPN